MASGAVEVTEFQQNFSRAGHAHAGVLVTLSLVALVYAAALTRSATGLQILTGHHPAGPVSRVRASSAARRRGGTTARPANTS